MSTPSSLPPLDDTLGAVFIGYILCSILYGVSVVQCLFYYTHYPNDSKYLRLLVAVAFVLDTMPIILIGHSLYFFLIKNFANPPVLGQLIWSGQLEVLFGGLTALLVQCFYIVRIWRLSQNRLLTGFILLLSLLLFANVLYWVQKTLRMKTYDQLTTISHWTMAGNALQAAVDVIIAFCICYFLHTSRSAFKQTNLLINKLILFFVNTGLLTSMFAVAVFICAAVVPHTLIHAAWYFCIGRLYTNSLLAALNGRTIVQGQVKDIDISMYSISTARSTTARSTTGPRSIALTLETMTRDSDRKPVSEQSVIQDKI